MTEPEAVATLARGAMRALLIKTGYYKPGSVASCPMCPFGSPDVQRTITHMLMEHSS